MGVGVGLERGFEVVGDADVVHHEAAGFVLKHAVHAGDGLHEVVALHRLIDIHRVAARGVEAGQPHVAHDHEAQRVGRVLEAFFDALLLALGGDVGLERGVVGGAAGHHDLDRALLDVGVVPDSKYQELIANRIARGPW